MKKKNFLLRRTALRLACLIVASCADSARETQEETTCHGSAAIIVGHDQLGSAWDAVGTLGIIGASGEYEDLCTATLVGSTVVLTAKHCVGPLARAAQRDGGSSNPVFAVGPSAKRPLHTVPTIGSVLIKPNNGGYTQVGSDLALFRLASAIQGLKPLTLSSSAVDDAFIGKQMLVVGYGATSPSGQQNSVGDDSVRQAGTVTVRATQGNLLDLIYGGKANCIAGKVQPGVFDPGSDCQIRSASAQPCEPYEQTELLPGYEFWAGAREHDSQTCQGDSGGPLLLDGPTPSIVGVVSWGWRSPSRSCSYGTVFAAVTSELRAAVATASP